MIYKGFIFQLIMRVMLMVSVILGIIYWFYRGEVSFSLFTFLAFLVIFYNTYFFIQRRFLIIEDFFTSIKYRDFSRGFSETVKAKDIRFLYQGFNQVHQTIKEINSQNHTQYLYLQKILEMVDIGIIAYDLETGKVLWSNDSFQKILDVPSFKNVSFIERRKPELFNLIFETFHRAGESVSITLNNEKIKALVSDTIFEVDNDTFKLLVIQNIDNTLSKNESESWKRLLSVMTHEIMNSITPIASLANTLERNLKELISENINTTELSDLNAGIKTIKNRSEGLLKFAKTYRSLNKVTSLNLQRIKVSELFTNIQLLMKPSIKAKGIQIDFVNTNHRLAFEIDVHLIEQVLINLLLNAVDACKEKENPKIKVEAIESITRNILIKVADNGIGIPEDIQENIFVPFFTSKESGSGIGLSLCKQIMLLHKGKIQVKSMLEEGTVFTLSF
ncbi:ATP-binding protein [Tenacibaculum sp. SZ-18]|uniref:sensor histidine kinase n=1 Tax=Tenacibaculum sp. SZ-18 TaxID=754423 RepID=UPI000C2D54E2|nr:HAMP domain-containing sensor histidine kinase [Tenacibaculum sp. SZ-18]AUC15947.1 ATP-binding protein [Tenacibaculum sp. SZ-18]